MTLSGKTGPVAHSAQIFVGTGLVSRLEASLGSHQQHIRISDDRSIALVSTPIPYKFVIGACQPFQTEIAFAGIFVGSRVHRNVHGNHLLPGPDPGIQAIPVGTLLSHKGIVQRLRRIEVAVTAGSVELIVHGRFRTGYKAIAESPIGQDAEPALLRIHVGRVVMAHTLQHILLAAGRGRMIECADIGYQIIFAGRNDLLQLTFGIGIFLLIQINLSQQAAGSLQRGAGSPVPVFQTRFRSEFPGSYSFRKVCLHEFPQLFGSGVGHLILFRILQYPIYQRRSPPQSGQFEIADGSEEFGLGNVSCFHFTFSGIEPLNHQIGQINRGIQPLIIVFHPTVRGHYRTFVYLLRIHLVGAGTTRIEIVCQEIFQEETVGILRGFLTTPGISIPPGRIDSSDGRLTLFIRLIIILFILYTFLGNIQQIDIACGKCKCTRQQSGQDIFSFHISSIYYLKCN